MECPRCDSTVRWDVSYCPECGLNIEKLRELLERWQCPRCDSSLRQGTTECGECGLAIGTLRERVLQPPEGEPQSSPGQRGGPQQEPGQQSGQPQHSGPEQPPEHPQQGQPEGQSQPESGPQPQGDDQRQQPPQDQRPPNGSGQPGDAADGAHAAGANAGHATEPASGAGGPAPGPAAEPTEPPPAGSGQPAGGQQQANAPPQDGTGAYHQPAAGGRSWTELVRSLPLIPGAVVGVVAYVVGLLSMFGLTLFEFSDDTDIVLTSVSGLEFSGWLLYNAHTVSIELVSGIQQRSFNYLEQMYVSGVVTQGSLTVPKLVYYLVPILVLFVGGFVVARRHRSREGGVSTTEGVLAGGSLAVGYTAMAALGAVTVFSITEGSGGAAQTAAPPLVDAALVMGVGVPLVVGGVAGYLATR